MTTAFQANAFQAVVLAFQIDSGPTPPTDGNQQQGGGDSTRLAKRGKRPKYFWEQAIEQEKKDVIAEAVFDAVADAYQITRKAEFESQVEYLQAVEKRLRKARVFRDIVEQLQRSLKELKEREELRFLIAKAQEESELRELMEII